MRLLNVGALAALAVLCSGCGGCGTVGQVLDPNHGVLEQSKIDEVALGFALSGGTVLNNSYALAVESGVLTDKALDTRIWDGLQKYDVLVKGARDAQRLGDAKGYLNKISAARALFDELIALIPTKKV